MPRLSALRIGALAELARQLRFESKDAARRQLVRAEGLAMELLEAGADAPTPSAFPEEWVIFRITGLRTDAPMSGGAGTAEAAMLVREAVLGDLSALIERLSSAAGIREGGLPAKRTKAEPLGSPWLDAAGVCARWSISRKTLERYRRMGLIGRRVQLGKGKERVVFSEDVLRAFERVHRVRIGEAESFSRIPKNARAGMIEEARSLRAEKKWTLDRCAREIGKRHGRAVETVRQVLKTHDERAAGGSEPIFSERGPLTGHERGVAEHAAGRGGKITVTAARLGRKRGTVYRVLNDRRAARLRGLELGGHVSLDFEKAGAEKKFLDVGVAREGLSAAGLSDAGSVITEAAGIGPVSVVVERARAGAYWYLRWRAVCGVKALPRHGASSGALDAIERDLLWASRVKAELVRSQLPLIVRAVEAQTGRAVGDLSDSERGEAVRVGLRAVIEAVEQFDPFKGGRLAAPVGVALGRAVSGWMLGKASVYVATLTAAQAAGRARRMSIPASGDDWTRRVNEWQAWLDIDRAMIERVGAMKEREKRVVWARFGLDGRPPRTVVEATAELGMTATRVAAVQRRALAG